MHRTARRKVCGCVLLSYVLMSGCGPTTQERDWESYPSQIEALAARHRPLDSSVESQNRGRRIYDHYCQICHGSEADGNGFNAAMLDPSPRNFTESAFWKQAHDENLVEVITHGGKAAGKSNLMPTWGRTLSRQQIRDVVAFLRTVPNRTKPTEVGESDAGS